MPPNARFHWDPQKAIENEKKHGLSFELAALVFADPFAKSAQDRFENGEYRWQTIGVIKNVVVVVAHTLEIYADYENIRIISARRANRNERKIYEESQ